MEVVAGIDLGGTGCRFVIYGEGRCVAARTNLTAQLAAGSEATRIVSLAETILAITPAGSRLKSVGLGATGPVDRVQGRDPQPRYAAGFLRVSSSVRVRGAPRRPGRCGQ